MNKNIKRALRVSAFGLGTGIMFMGAGNIWGFEALQSAGFGATGAVLGLIAVLAFTYAGKGNVPEKDFDNAINEAIETVNSKTKKKD